MVGLALPRRAASNSAVWCASRWPLQGGVDVAAAAVLRAWPAARERASVPHGRVLLVAGVEAPPPDGTELQRPTNRRRRVRVPLPPSAVAKLKQLLAA
jgi:hypothetical protein